MFYIIATHRCGTVRNFFGCEALCESLCRRELLPRVCCRGVSPRSVSPRAVSPRAVSPGSVSPRSVSREQWSRSREHFRVVAGEIWRYFTTVFAFAYSLYVYCNRYVYCVYITFAFILLYCTYMYIAFI
jgi:hypothetical protein